MVLMARAALFGGHSVPQARPHIHGVGMAVIALSREVTARMAVHAAGMRNTLTNSTNSAPLAAVGAAEPSP